MVLDQMVALVADKIFTNKDPRLPYIGLEHIAQGKPRLVGKAESCSSISVNSIFKKDDILFGKLRPNLRKSVRAPFDGYCSTDILVLRSQEGIDSAFAGHIFQWERVFDVAAVTAVGTKMPRASWRDLKTFSVRKPASVHEQIRIAHTLDTIDDAIAKTEAVIAKLRQLRAGLLHDLLTCGLDKNSQLRDPIAHPEQFKDSPLGRIPREWVIESLGESLRRNAGMIQTGPFGSQLHAHEYTTEGVPVIMPQDILEGGFDVSRIARIPEPRADELNRHRVKFGDLIFARRGDLSRCAAVSDREVGWLCGTGCLLMRFERQALSSKWLSFAYQHDIGQRQIAARAVGTTMVNLNTTLLAHLSFAFPPKQEQDIVVRCVEEVDALFQKDMAILQALSLSKSGLVSDLLTGSVSVPEAMSRQWKSGRSGNHD
jgi:type I restriction enzyme S subunit